MATAGSRKGKGKDQGGGGSGEFEEFDVGSGDEPPAGEFEEFDPTAEEEVAAGGQDADVVAAYAEDGFDVQALLEARQELEDKMLVEPAEVAFAVAEDGAAGLGNMVGVGIGEKEVGGQPTGQLAVKVFVKEKLPESEIAAEAVVPAAMGGVETDVDEVGDIWTERFVARLRPAPGGVSIGNCGQVLAGTLGCLVFRGRELFLLSNNHVIALSNRAPLGSGIPQPGRLDGGVCNRDVIARLSQFVPILFGGAANRVDAAIARTSPRLVDRRILRPLGIRRRLRPPEVLPVVGRLVQKSGRTTQYRRGIVSATNVTVNVNYGPPGGIARFVGQFSVRGIAGIFSDRGDSGSLVTNFPLNQPMGLLFAGNAATNITFCNPIRTVLGAFGVRILY